PSRSPLRARYNGTDRGADQPHHFPIRCDATSSVRRSSVRLCSNRRSLLNRLREWQGPARRPGGLPSCWRELGAGGSLVARIFRLFGRPHRSASVCTQRIRSPEESCRPLALLLGRCHRRTAGQVFGYPLLLPTLPL